MQVLFVSSQFATIIELVAIWGCLSKIYLIALDLSISKHTKTAFWSVYGLDTR